MSEKRMKRTANYFPLSPFSAEAGQGGGGKRKMPEISVPGKFWHESIGPFIWMIKST